MNTNFINEVKANFEVPTLVRSEKIGKKITDFYEITTYGKDKEGKETTTTLQIRDKATVALLSDIDVLAYMAKGSIKAFVIAMGKLNKEVAKKHGFKSVVDMVAKAHMDYSKTTLNLYRRIGLMFGGSGDGYEWKEGIPSSVTVNNLSVVLALAIKGKDLEECTTEEIEELWVDFYDNYIADGTIVLTTTQAELKKQVKAINSGIIDGDVKVVDQGTTDQGTTDQGTTDKEKVNTDTISKISVYSDTISEMSEYFKDNETIVNAIATIMKELSIMAQAQEENSENSEN